MLRKAAVIWYSLISLAINLGDTVTWHFTPITLKDLILQRRFPKG